MKLAGKKIALLGYAKTGQSVARFLSERGAFLTVFEPAALNSEQQDLIQTSGITLQPRNCTQSDVAAFDYIVPSPGVPIDDFITTGDQRLLSELDLFAQFCTKKTIAITGSVGKTTMVTLLTELLNRVGIKAIAVGNVGTPMLDLIATQEQYEYIVLELSSFQLEHSSHFAPTIGAITNLFPNHLDRHKTMENYAKAKAQIFAHQKGSAFTLIPEAYQKQFASLISNHNIKWLSATAYEDQITDALLAVTFRENWRMLLAILEQCAVNIKKIQNLSTDLQIPEHRCEYLGTYQKIFFYNDSKSTIPQATLATVKALTEQKKAPIILFLGGLSKGVNRKSLVKELPPSIKQVVCFGKEAEELNHFCKEQGLLSSSFSSLEEAFQACTKIATEGDIVLFSPSGASYDLFKNYEERGNHFKGLVNNYYGTPTFGEL